MKFSLDNKVILITGGTGSFGQSFVKKVIEYFSPKKLIVFSRDELKQSEMQLKYSTDYMRYFIGDVRDLSRLEEACMGVDYVVHAAAIKQVPVAEYNPTECIRTNIGGAENIIKASIKSGVKAVIALSTDKAANPVNLYGATKLASDKLFIAANNIVGPRETRFSVVRYGNVLGSRGSVIPFFRELVEKNVDYLPITHNDMTRFVITLEQGVEFVLRGFSRMQGGEIFVPKIPSVSIQTIASVAGNGLPTKVVGIRPGEKLHEVMCPSDDSHLTIEFDDYFVIQPTIQMREHVEYNPSKMGEIGKLVKQGFEYQSGTNTHFLGKSEFGNLLKQAGV